MFLVKSSRLSLSFRLSISLSLSVAISVSLLFFIPEGLEPGQIAPDLAGDGADVVVLQGHRHQLRQGPERLQRFLISRGFSCDLTCGFERLN